MPRLAGKVAIITGAGTGIGEASARIFAAEGAKVVANGRRPAPVEEVVAKIKGAGGEAIAVPGDASKPEDIDRLIARTLDTFGRIDVLFNNAAIGDDEKILHEMDPADWDRIIEVNLRGVFLLSRAVIPHMLQHGGGSIIHNSSRNAVQGAKHASAYTAAKGALISLTRSMAVEYAEHHIRVNSIVPGLVITPMTTEMSEPFLTGKQPMWPRAPLGRLGNPEDIAWGAVYLASDESEWVTGIALPIDGGRGIL
jgi:NAD(P)-dependent dehydrogenase (short-subunit alcohol dehydrogenase family)